MGSAPRTLTVATIASPHKVFLLVVCALGGIIGLFSPSSISSSIDAAIPGPLYVVWFGGLAVTSILGLYGTMKGTLRGLLWERVALLTQAVLLVAFAVAIVGANGHYGLGSLLFYGGFAAANVYRAWILTRAVRLYPPRSAASVTPPDD